MASRNNIVCLDFETGGFDCLKQPITQIGMRSIRLEDFSTINTYSTYVCGYGDLEYTQDALNATGITMEMIDGGITIEQAVKDMTAFFKEANTGNHISKNPVLLGHNVCFDISFLQYAFNYCKKIDILKKVVQCKPDGFGNPYPLYHDTMLESRRMWGGDVTMPKFRLGDCCTKAGIELVDAHDAMNDVNATAELFIWLSNRMRAKSENVVEKVEEEQFRPKFNF